MIDLRKAELLQSTLDLPYTFLVPNTLFDNEWLCLSEQEREDLRERGLEIWELPGPLVERAAKYFNENRSLALNDCFALVLAEEIGSVLLTGDGSLRKIADGKGVPVRGCLWVTDELQTHEIVPLRTLYEALRLFHEDVFVFLPAAEIQRRLRRLAGLLRRSAGS